MNNKETATSTLLVLDEIIETAVNNLESLREYDQVNRQFTTDDAYVCAQGQNLFLYQSRSGNGVSIVYAPHKATIMTYDQARKLSARVSNRVGGFSPRRMGQAIDEAIINAQLVVDTMLQRKGELELKIEESGK